MPPSTTLSAWLFTSGPTVKARSSVLSHGLCLSVAVVALAVCKRYDPLRRHRMTRHHLSPRQSFIFSGLISPSLFIDDYIHSKPPGRRQPKASHRRLGDKRLEQACLPSLRPPSLSEPFLQLFYANFFPLLLFLIYQPIFFLILLFFFLYSSLRSVWDLCTQTWGRCGGVKEKVWKDGISCMGIQLTHGNQ